MKRESVCVCECVEGGKWMKEEMNETEENEIEENEIEENERERERERSDNICCQKRNPLCWM